MILQVGFRILFVLTLLDVFLLKNLLSFIAQEGMPLRYQGRYRSYSIRLGFLLAALALSMVLQLGLFLYVAGRGNCPSSSLPCGSTGSMACPSIGGQNKIISPMQLPLETGTSIKRRKNEETAVGNFTSGLHFMQRGSFNYTLTIGKAVFTYGEMPRLCYAAEGEVNMFRRPITGDGETSTYLFHGGSVLI